VSGRVDVQGGGQLVIESAAMFAETVEQADIGAVVGMIAEIAIVTMRVRAVAAVPALAPWSGGVVSL
jgi:hypothetical protein